MARKIDLSELQNSVGQLLGGDAELTTLLGSRNGRIQGAASPKVDLPYVSIGESDIGDTSVQGLAAKRVRFMCHVWTNERGFTQNKQIEAAIVAALDDNVWVVPNLRVVSCFHERSDFMRDPMEGVRHGVVEFDIEVEPRFETGINAPATGVGAALANLTATGGTVYINAPATATGAVGAGLGNTISIDAPANGLGAALANLSISGRIDINAPATGTGASQASPLITVSVDAPATGTGAAEAGIQIAGVVSLNSPATAVGASEANLGLTVPAFGAANATGVAEANLSVVVSASGAASGVGAAEANLSISGQVSINAPATGTGAAQANPAISVSVSAPATATGAAQANPAISVSVSAPATATGASQANAEITVNAQGAATGVGTAEANLSVSGAGGGNEAETDAFIARMSVAPDATLEGHIDTLFATLKAGGVLTKVEGMFLPVLHSDQASLLDWMDNFSPATLSGGAVLQSGRGVPIVSSEGLITGFDFSTLTLFDAANRQGHWGAAIHTPSANADSRDIREGSNQTSNRSDSGQARVFGGSNFSWAPTTTEATVFASSGDAVAGEERGFVNGVQVHSDTSVGGTAATGTLDIGRGSYGANASGNTAIYSGIWVGAELTQAEGETLTGAIKTFLDAVLVYP